MDPLSSLDNIAELIRRRASEGATSKLDKTYSDKLAKARQKHALEKKKTAENVKHKIVTALQAVNDQEPENYQKMMTIFVENVLLWQFNDALANDPHFRNLVDEVSATLLQEPLVIEQLQKL